MNHAFEFPIKIREQHLDTFGHVNNAVYLMIFESARWDLINQSGYGIEKIKETGLGPTLLEVTVKFLKEIKLHTEIIVKTKLRSYEGKIGIIDQWMEDKDGRKYCEAEFKIALFDTKLRKLVAPTPEWLAALKQT